MLSRFLIWASLFIWRSRMDWRTYRPLLTRATAHVSIILLTVVVVALGGVRLASPVAAGVSLSAPTGTAVTTLPVPQPTATLSSRVMPANAPIARIAQPHTLILNRPRAEVITYTVQPGDNLSTIAQTFGLSIWTIIWSNRGSLWDAPWLIQPGLPLYIPPVDGVYHTVMEGETVESIAAQYGVEPAALYNEWNSLREGEPLQPGQLVMVVGGRDEYIDLEPPPIYASPGAASGSWGVCSGVEAVGPGANGWFIYPTGSSRVSGWYFHDIRNPTHIGLDYGCRTGDPIYAADNGVVTIAGWNGGYGNLVEVTHGNGFVTRYAHLSEIAVGCGQSVYQGQIVGYCGSTGWSTGAHLHFEVRYGGVPQDPQYYLP